jgi:hypothetical protein
MRSKKVIKLLLFGLLLLATAPSWAKTFVVCDVADPTGTPLKVRTLPNKNAIIVFQFENRTPVIIDDRQGQWAFVHGFQKVSENASDLAGAGWVWYPYLTKCFQDDSPHVN